MLRDVEDSLNHSLLHITSRKVGHPPIHQSVIHSLTPNVCSKTEEKGWQERVRGLHSEPLPVATDPTMHHLTAGSTEEEEENCWCIHATEIRQQQTEKCKITVIMILIIMVKKKVCNQPTKQMTEGATKWTGCHSESKEMKESGRGEAKL